MELLPQHILRRIHTRSVSLLIAAFLAVSGVWMIFVGIKTDGMIDITSPFLTGKIKAGFIGVSLIFFSALIVLAALRNLKAHVGSGQFRPMHKVSVKSNDAEITWEGPLHKWEEGHFVSDLLGAITEAATKEAPKPSATTDS